MRHRWVPVLAALAVGAVVGYRVGAAPSRPTVGPPSPIAPRAAPPRRPQRTTLHPSDGRPAEIGPAWEQLHDWCGTPSLRPYGATAR